jgi:hypothetical protein
MMSAENVYLSKISSITMLLNNSVIVFLLGYKNMHELLLDYMSQCCTGQEHGLLRINRSLTGSVKTGCPCNRTLRALKTSRKHWSQKPTQEHLSYWKRVL